MRALHGADYTDDEREGFRLSIHQNIIETMEVLCDAIRVVKKIPSTSHMKPNINPMFSMVVFDDTTTPVKT